MATTPDSIWLISTEARFNAVRRPPPAYLSRAQAIRFERIRQSRALYEGDHFRFFVGENRTQFQFPRMMVNDEVITVFVLNNLLKRISHTSADLLFGDEPLLRVDDAVQSARLKELVDRTNFHAVLNETEIECSFAGEGVLEACIVDNQVYVVQVPAEEIHPIGMMGPDRQFASYVRYAEINIGTAEAPRVLILQTLYKVGSIERKCYAETVADPNEVALASWPPFAGNPPPDVQPTGVAMNTIIWLPNLMTAGRVLSDYDGLLGLQDTLNAKETQIAVVLAKHSNPKLRAPRAAADDNGDLRASSDVLYADNPQDWGYLDWEAKLGDARAERDHAQDAMCVASETSPVLLGLDRGGVPDSARAMKLRASSSIAKAQRKATLRRPLIKRALTVAQLLEQTILGNRYSVGPISAETRDGLPVDDGEKAQTIATLRAAGAMSIERAVEIQIPDPAAAKQEVERIEAANAAAAPSVMLGDSPSPAAPKGGDEDTEGPDALSEAA